MMTADRRPVHVVTVDDDEITAIVHATDGRYVPHDRDAPRAGP